MLFSIKRENVMYSQIYQKILFPFYEGFLRKRNTLEYLRRLDKNQWLSRDELLEFQWNELKNLLSHAYENVPFYTETFREHGLTPYDIKDPDDFRKLPIIDKPTIKSNWDKMVAKNIPNILTKSTGGSTGDPLHFVYTRDSYEWRRAITMRGYSWAGYKEGDKVAYLWGFPIGDISRFYALKTNMHRRIQNMKYFNIFDLSSQTMESYFRAMKDYKPKHIVAYGLGMYYFAKFINDMGWQSFPLESIILGAEKVHKDQIKVIESTFNCQVFNTYGCSEFMLIASQCEYRGEMHLNAENLYVETLRNNIPAAEGEMGEVVITDLHNYGMPFIRYRNGDLAIPSKQSCPCGRGLPLIADVEGRLADMITTTDGRIVTGLYFVLFMLTLGVNEVEHYQIIQESKEKLIINIVPKTDIPQAKLELMRTEIQKVCGKAMNVEFKFVDEIPLTPSGKRRMVISKVPVSL
jgi:phenylacetate-CoA ligase